MRGHYFRTNEKGNKKMKRNFRNRMLALLLAVVCVMSSIQLPVKAEGVDVAFTSNVIAAENNKNVGADSKFRISTHLSTTDHAEKAYCRVNIVAPAGTIFRDFENAQNQYVTTDNAGNQFIIKLAKDGSGNPLYFEYEMSAGEAVVAFINARVPNGTSQDQVQVTLTPTIHMPAGQPTFTGDSDLTPATMNFKAALAWNDVKVTDTPVATQLELVGAIPRIKDNVTYEIVAINKNRGATSGVVFTKDINLQGTITLPDGVVFPAGVGALSGDKKSYIIGGVTVATFNKPVASASNNAGQLVYTYVENNPTISGGIPTADIDSVGLGVSLIAQALNVNVTNFIADSSITHAVTFAANPCNTSVAGISSSANVGYIIGKPNGNYSLQKTNSPTSATTVVDKTSFITYTIKATNNGIVPETVTISDAIPVGTVYAIDGGHTPTAGIATTGNPVTKVSWNNVTLNPGESKTFTFYVKVADGTKSKTTFSNIAQLTDAKGTTNSNRVSNTFDAGENIRMTKEVDRGQVVRGDVVTYTIKISNNHTLKATDSYVLTDQLPDGITMDATQIAEWTSNYGGSYNADTRTLTATVPVIASSGEKNYTFKANIVKDFTNNHPLTNTASINALGLDASAVTRFYVEEEKLTLGKKADKSSAMLGEEVTYTLTLGNASNVVNARKVTDTLPSQMTIEPAEITRLTSAYSSAGYTFSFSGQVLTINNVKIPAKNTASPATIIYKAKIINKTTNNTNMTNIAAIPDMGITAQVNVRYKEGLFLSKHVSQATISNRGNVTWTITVVNENPVLAETNKTIVDTLPEGVLLTPEQLAALKVKYEVDGVQVEYDEESHVVTFSNVTIPAKSTVKYDIPTAIDVSTFRERSLVNTATMDDLEDTAAIYCIHGTIPVDLEKVRTEPVEVSEGCYKTTYTVSMLNLSGRPTSELIEPLKFVDTMTGGLAPWGAGDQASGTLVGRDSRGVSIPGTWERSEDEEGKYTYTVSWLIPEDISNRETYRLTYDTEIYIGDKSYIWAQNRVRVVGSVTGDPEARAEDIILERESSIDKKITKINGKEVGPLSISALFPGDEIEYTITAKNNSDRNASTGKITDELPPIKAGSEFAWEESSNLEIESTDVYTINNNSIIWEDINLGKGEERSYKITLKYPHTEIFKKTIGKAGISTLNIAHYVSNDGAVKLREQVVHRTQEADIEFKKTVDRNQVDLSAPDDETAEEKEERLTVKFTLKDFDVDGHAVENMTIMDKLDSVRDKFDIKAIDFGKYTIKGLDEEAKGYRVIISFKDTTTLEVPVAIDGEVPATALSSQDKDIADVVAVLWDFGDISSIAIDREPTITAMAREDAFTGDAKNRMFVGYNDKNEFAEATVRVMNSQSLTIKIYDVNGEEVNNTDNLIKAGDLLTVVTTFTNNYGVDLDMSEFTALQISNHMYSLDGTRDVYPVIEHTALRGRPLNPVSSTVTKVNGGTWASGNISLIPMTGIMQPGDIITISYEVTVTDKLKDALAHGTPGTYQGAESIHSKAEFISPTTTAVNAQTDYYTPEAAVYVNATMAIIGSTGVHDNRMYPATNYSYEKGATATKDLTHAGGKVESMLGERSSLICALTIRNNRSSTTVLGLAAPASLTAPASPPHWPSVQVDSNSSWGTTNWEAVSTGGLMLQEMQLRTVTTQIGGGWYSLENTNSNTYPTYRSRDWSNVTNGGPLSYAGHSLSDPKRMANSYIYPQNIYPETNRGYVAVGGWLSSFYLNPGLDPGDAVTYIIQVTGPYVNGNSSITMLGTVPILTGSTVPIPADALGCWRVPEGTKIVVDDIPTNQPTLDQSRGIHDFTANLGDSSSSISSEGVVNVTSSVTAKTPKTTTSLTKETVGIISGEKLQQKGWNIDDSNLYNTWNPATDITSIDDVSVGLQDYVVWKAGIKNTNQFLLADWILTDTLPKEYELVAWRVENDMASSNKSLVGNANSNSLSHIKTTTNGAGEQTIVFNNGGPAGRGYSSNSGRAPYEGSTALYYTNNLSLTNMDSFDGVQGAIQPNAELVIYIVAKPKSDADIELKDYTNKVHLDTFGERVDGITAGVQASPIHEKATLAIEANADVSVGGKFGSNAIISATDENDVTAIGKGGANFINIKGSEDFTYTMELNSKASVPLTSLVLIDRLPMIGDGGAINIQSKRGSDFDVVFASNPNVTVEVKANDGTYTTLDPSKYVVEYKSVGPLEEFTTQDWAGTSVWSTDPTGATAIRVRMINSYALPALASIQVNFDAKANNLEVEMGNKAAWNSFGYQYQAWDAIASETQTVKAEPAKVGARLMYANIALNKENNKGEKLADAIFGVYSDATCTPANLIELITTDKDGVATTTSNLISGIYYVKETEAPDKYFLNNTIFTVDLTSAVSGATVFVDNGTPIINGKESYKLDINKSFATTADIPTADDWKIEIGVSGTFTYGETTVQKVLTKADFAGMVGSTLSFDEMIAGNPYTITEKVLVKKSGETGFTVVGNYTYTASGTLDKDGSLITVDANGTFTSSGNCEINMVNKEAEPGTLKIKKTVNGTPIGGEPFTINVEGTFLEGGVEETKVVKLKFGEGGDYALDAFAELTNVIYGETYTVYERGSASALYTTSPIQLPTIDVLAGSSVEVVVTNTPKPAGKLVLKKEIDGAAPTSADGPFKVKVKGDFSDTTAKEKEITLGYSSNAANSFTAEVPGVIVNGLYYIEETAETMGTYTPSYEGLGETGGVTIPTADKTPVTTVKVNNQSQPKGSITVVKEIDKNTFGENQTFTFELTGKVDGVPKTFIGTVTISGSNIDGEVKWTENGTPVDLDDLDVNEEYILKQTSNNTSYNFISYTCDDDAVTTQSDGIKVTLTASELNKRIVARSEEKKGRLKLSKELVSAQATTAVKTFEFTLQGPLKSDGTTISGVTETYDGIVTVAAADDYAERATWKKGGASIMLNALPVGRYKLTEKEPGAGSTDFTFTNFSINNASPVTTNPVSFDITGNETSEIEILAINTEKTAKASISKAIEANTLNMSETFTFELKGGGTTYYGTTSTASTGTITWRKDSATGNIVTLDALPFGSYTLKETNLTSNDNYTFSKFTMGATTDTTNNLTFTLSETNNDVTILANNKVKSGDFKVAKVLNDVDGNPRTKEASETLGIGIYEDAQATTSIQIETLVWDSATEQYLPVSFNNIPYGSYYLREMVLDGAMWKSVSGVSDFAYDATYTNQTITLSSATANESTPIATITNNERSIEADIEANKAFDSAGDATILNEHAFTIAITRADGEDVTPGVAILKLNVDKTGSFKKVLAGVNLRPGVYKVEELDDTSGAWVKTAFAGTIGGEALSVSAMEGTFTLEESQYDQAIDLSFTATNKATSKKIDFTVQKMVDSLETANKTFKFNLVKEVGASDVIIAVGSITKTQESVEAVTTWKTPDEVSTFDIENYLWEVGSTYKVIEQANNHYKLDSVTGYDLTYVTSGGLNVGVSWEMKDTMLYQAMTFANKQNTLNTSTDPIFLEKKVIRGVDTPVADTDWFAGSAFGFTLYKKTGAELEPIGNYTRSDGNKLTLTVHAGEDILVGGTYYLKETSVTPSNGYELVDIQAKDASDVSVGIWDSNEKILSFVANADITLTATNQIQEGNITLENEQVGGVTGKEFTYTVNIGTPVEVDGKLVKPTTPYVGNYTFYPSDGSPSSVKSTSDGTIKLKDGDKIEILRVPLGNAYSIEQTSEAGYTTTIELDSVAHTDESVLDKVKTDSEAKFTNTYASTGSATLGVKKTVTGIATFPAFTFNLGSVGSDGVTVTPITTVQSDTSGNAEKTFAAITYNQTQVTPGTPVTFTYEISEGQGSVTGYTYDKNKYRVDVTITDNGDGTITSAITDAQKLTPKADDSGYDSSPITTGSGGKQIVDFTNVYKALPTTYIVPVVTKTVPGDTPIAGTSADNATFTFTITTTGTNPLPTKADGTVEATITRSGAGTANFENIKFAEEGTYVYTIKETNGGIAGYAYDTQEYVLTIVVTDVSGNLTVTSETIKKKDGTSVATVDFSNVYTTTTATYLPDVISYLDNVAPANDKFDFIIEQTGQKDKGGSTVSFPVYREDIKNDGTGKVDFAGITYTDEGTYIYKLTEVDGTASDATIIYDGSEYIATVVVTRNADNSLTAVTTYTKDGDSYNKPKVEFYNITYTPAKVTIDIENIITGDTPVVDKDFGYTLTAKDATTPMPGDTLGGTKVITITGAGKETYTKIDYTKPGTYEYTVVQNPMLAIGYTCDEAVYKIVVTIAPESPGSAVLKETVVVTKDGVSVTIGDVYNESTHVLTLEYINHYKALPTQADVPALNKALSGDTPYAGTPADDATFTFKLTPKDLTNPMPLDSDDLPITTAITHGEGTVNFGEIKFVDVGVYIYEITETEGIIAGYAYDKEVYTLTFTVADGDGQLVVTSEMKNKAGDVKTSADFTNDYITPAVKHSPEGLVYLDDKLADKDKFNFVIERVDGVTDKDELKNGANGVIPYEELTFTKEGTYTYKLTAVDESKDNPTIIYDNSEYTMVVTVTRNPDNSLNIETVYTKDGVAYTEEKVEFRHITYTPTDITFEIENLIGGDKPEKDEEFKFTLTGGSDDTPMPGGTFGGSQEVIITGEGIKGFDKIVYDSPGVYEYTITQVTLDKDGYEIDRTEYKITVTVTGEGTSLKKEITITKDGVPMEVPASYAETGILKVTYTNTYKKKEGETPSPTTQPTPTGAVKKPTTTPAKTTTKTITKTTTAAKTGDMQSMAYVYGAGGAVLAIVMLLVSKRKRRTR